MLKKFLKSYKTIVVCFLFVLTILWVLFFLMPKKITLNSEISQLVFGYSVEDEFNIKDQVSYVLGNTIGSTASIDKNHNVTFYASKFNLLKWKNTCKKIANMKSKAYVEASDNKVVVLCTKDEVSSYLLKADKYVEYFVVKQLVDGVPSERINVEVTVIDESSNEILIYANWPMDEYNIDINEF